MGWFFEDITGHEGYVIGYMTRDDCSRGSGLYRELAYPRDEFVAPAECIAAGCDCGWRSPRWVPRLPAEWGPFSVMAAQVDDESAHQLWLRHIELDVRTPHPLRIDATRTQAELVRRGERAAPCGGHLLCIQDARKPDGIWHEEQCPRSRTSQ